MSGSLDSSLEKKFLSDDPSIIASSGLSKFENEFTSSAFTGEGIAAAIIIIIPAVITVVRSRVVIGVVVDCKLIFAAFSLDKRPVAALYTRIRRSEVASLRLD